MTDKKHTGDIPIMGEPPPRYEVVIGECIKGVPNVVDKFDSLDDARACLARKKRLDKDCHIWDRHTKKKVV
jgi:hypothetical protein